jgi:pyruvate/2-oxoglutarate/acetoin dehydrogenase E1 component
MRTVSYTEAIRETLAEEMQRDADVFLFGEDIGVYGGAFGVTRGLLDRFGADRVIDTPISEASFVGAAIGAALAGSRPVVEIMFMDFITLAMDQILNQAAKLHYVLGEQARCPLVIRTPAGGGRCYGPTHSQSLEGMFLHVPGLRIVAPSTPADARGLLKAAIRDDNAVLFVEHKLLYAEKGPVPFEEDSVIPMGKAAVVREGDDVTILAWSQMTIESLAAAGMLAEEEVNAEVVDLRSLSPLDMETVAASVRKTGRVLVVDEGPRSGGASAEIACRIAESVFDYLDAPVRRLTTPDVPVPASPPLEQAALPNADTIADAAVALVEYEG